MLTLLVIRPSFLYLVGNLRMLMGLAQGIRILYVSCIRNQIKKHRIGLWLEEQRK